jgi:hypothetical protein
MNHPRRAYIDDDSYHAIDQAIHLLAPFRGCARDPRTATFTDADLLHLLASLILHAQTWMFHTIDELTHDEETWLSDDDIDHILAGTNPDPVSWPAPGT